MKPVKLQGMILVGWYRVTPEKGLGWLVGILELIFDRALRLDIFTLFQA